MFGFLQRLSVGGTMIILTLSGFLAAFVFFALQFSSDLLLKHNTENDRKLAALSQTIGLLTHELQKERGASAGFIASQGTAFVQELPAQRLASDAIITNFNEYGQVVLSLDIPPELRNQLRSVDAQLDGLKELRQQIDALEVQLPDVVAQITLLNQTAIELLIHMGKRVSHAPAANAMQRHAILMKAKDISGLERATGASGFAQAAKNNSGVPEDVRNRFLELVLEQDSLFLLYQSLATDVIAEAAKRLNDTDASNEVRRLRKIVRENLPSDVAQITRKAGFRQLPKRLT